MQPWDTAGQGELDNIRILSYANTDVFILCFSLVNPKSLESIKNVWIKELRKNVVDPQIMLAGLDVDLRDEFENKPDECKSRQIEPVSTAEGNEMAKKIKALAYFECSVTKGTNVNELFDAAISHTFKPKSCEIF